MNAGGERAMDAVRVALGARSYEVRIGSGLVTRAGAEIAPLLARPKVAIVTEERVAALHLETLKAGLAAAGIEAQALVLPAGEATKCWGELQRTVEWLLAAEVERKDMVLAFGGGVIGDLVGFAAAILRRGIRFVQIPTTLLAQVDSSVGGKTGINSPHGKNLIGAFHQPALVLADIDMLDTLTPRDFLAGYGEVVKYGGLGSLAFFEWLEANGPALAAGGSAANKTLRQEAVRRSVQMKAGIVARDETEQGDRALLNLGHTCPARADEPGGALALPPSPGSDGDETRSGRCAGRASRCRRAAGADAAGQEGRCRPDPLHPRARHRRRVCRRRGRSRCGARRAGGRPRRAVVHAGSGPEDGDRKGDGGRARARAAAEILIPLDPAKR